MIRPELPNVRRRTTIFALAVGVVALLVALPAVGLYQINRASDDTHDYAVFASTLNSAVNAVTGLVVGPMLRYQEPSQAAERQDVIDGLEESYRKVAAVESLSGPIRTLGYGSQTTAWVASARAVLEQVSLRVGYVDQGTPVSQLPAA